MRHLFTFACCIFGSATALFAQNILSGTITSEKGEPLYGCHLHAGALFTISNADGSYEISVPSTTLQITVSHIGFKTMTKSVVVTSDSVLDFKLSVDVSDLKQVIVTSDGKSDVQIKNELKTKTIESYSNAALGDLVREIAGVSSLKTGSAIVKPVINGLHSSRVLVINNNVRLEDQQWGLEHAPNLDVNTAGKVVVIKGASGLQYGGDAVGGVILIEPPHIPIADTLYGRAVLNAASNGRGGSFSTSVFKGQKSGWNYNLQGTLKYIGDLQAPDYVLSNTGIREKNFSAGIGFKGEKSGFTAFYSYFNAEIGILRASHIGNITDLVNAINSRQPLVADDFSYDINAPKQQIQHHLAKFNYYRNYEAGKLSAQYAFQFNNRVEYDIRTGEDRDTPALDMDLFTHAVSVDFESVKNNDFSYQTGANAIYQSNTTHSDTGIRPLIPDYEKFEIGAYAIAKLKFGEKLAVESGLRYDFSQMDATKYYIKSRWSQRGYDRDFAQFITGDFGTQWKTNPQFQYHNVSGSLGMKYDLAKNLDWLLNLSAASRNPNPSELFSDGLHHATGQIELGDLRMKRENSVKISTSLNLSNDKFAIEINPYVNFIDDFMFLQPMGLEYTIRGAFPVWEYRQTSARLSGVDITADYAILPQLDYHTTFAYVYGKDMQTGNALIDIPSANWNNTITFKKSDWHEFAAGLKN